MCKIQNLKNLLVITKNTTDQYNEEKELCSWTVIFYLTLKDKSYWNVVSSSILLNPKSKYKFNVVTKFKKTSIIGPPWTAPDFLLLVGNRFSSSADVKFIWDLYLKYIWEVCSILWFSLWREFFLVKHISLFCEGFEEDLSCLELGTIFLCDLHFAFILLQFFTVFCTV